MSCGRKKKVKVIKRNSLKETSWTNIQIIKYAVVGIIKDTHKNKKGKQVINNNYSEIVDARYGRYIVGNPILRKFFGTPFR